MKRLFLLLVIGSSAYAMEPNKINSKPALMPDSVAKVAVAGTAASLGLKAAAVATPVATCMPPTISLWTLLIPSAPAVAVAAASVATAYGAYKGGEYLYNRYTKPANSNQ